MGTPRALGVIRPGHFARFWGHYWCALAHVRPGDRFPLLTAAKSEITGWARLAPRWRRKKCQKWVVRGSTVSCFETLLYAYGNHP